MIWGRWAQQNSQHTICYRQNSVPVGVVIKCILFEAELGTSLFAGIKKNAVATRQTTRNEANNNEVVGKGLMFIVNCFSSREANLFPSKSKTCSFSGVAT